MSGAVTAAAIAVAALNALAGMFGGWVWYRGGPADRRSATAFWVFLRVGQAAALVLALAVAVLAAAGRHPSEELFYLYALLPLPVALVAEQLRIASAQAILDRYGLADGAAVGGLPEDQQRGIVVVIVRREIGVMALSALVVSFLALRAAGTAHGF